ncbi:MAG: hypothetical protein WHV28_07780 [Bacteroidota bacterium]
MKNFQVLHFSFMSKKCFILNVLLLFSNCLYSQDIDDFELERYLVQFSSEEELTDVIETLEYYFANPIKLYKARPDALTVLPNINYYVSSAIIERFNNNPGSSYWSLFDGLELSDIQQKIIIKATDRDTISHRRFSSDYKVRSIERFETVRGLKEKKYLGDKYDIYQRFQANYSQFQIQAIGNKNLGEIYLYDFFSVGSKYQTDNLKLLVGDFAAAFGCGNTLWQTYSLGKGGDAVHSAAPYRNSINLNTSSMRTNFMRGAAIEYKFNHLWHIFTLTAFVSNAKRPANVDTAKNIATSIYTANYFRTKTEINKKDALGEKSVAVNFAYNHKKITLGATCFSIKYDYPLKSSSSRAFEGSSSTIISVYSLYSAPNISLGGEYSLYSEEFPAVKLYSLFKLNNVDFAVHYRNYHSNYRSFWGYNFGESSIPANEEGLYTAFSAKISKNLRAEAYLDLYRTHCRTYSVEKPIKGFDYSIKHIYDNKLLGSFFLLIRAEAKTDGFKPKGAQNQVIYTLRWNQVRFEFERRIIKNLTFKTRFDATDIDFEHKKPNENGYASYLQISYDVLKNLSITGRVSVFNTDSYSSAIWHYEYRMPTSVYTNPLYDEGSRVLLRINYSPLKYIKLYFAYTRLEKPKLENLGSSYDLIKGNKDNRLYLQINISYAE